MTSWKPNPKPKPILRPAVARSKRCAAGVALATEPDPGGLIPPIPCFKCGVPIGHGPYRLLILEDVADPERPGQEVTNGRRVLTFHHATCVVI